MKTLLLRADDVLRARSTVLEIGRSWRRAGALILLIITFGVIYGAVMGGFGGVAGTRAMQVCFSAIKVPILLLATFGLSLPSFFVVNTLLGLRGDFGSAVRALVATQAGLTIILASMAPLTALWYASSGNYDAAIVFNALMFAVAGVAAQALLRRFYQPLIDRDRRHRLLLRAWLVIYSFVGIQMGWILRPFVGHPAMPTRFFREDTWGNAYQPVEKSGG